MGTKSTTEAVALVGETSGGESPPLGSGLEDRGPLLWTRLCRDKHGGAPGLPAATQHSPFSPVCTEKLRPREGC